MTSVSGWAKLQARTRNEPQHQAKRRYPILRQSQVAGFNGLGLPRARARTAWKVVCETDGPLSEGRWRTIERFKWRLVTRLLVLPLFSERPGRRATAPRAARRVAPSPARRSDRVAPPPGRTGNELTRGYPSDAAAVLFAIYGSRSLAWGQLGELLVKPTGPILIDHEPAGRLELEQDLSPTQEMTTPHLRTLRVIECA